MATTLDCYVVVLYSGFAMNLILNSHYNYKLVVALLMVVKLKLQRTSAQYCTYTNTGCYQKILKPES